MTYTPNISPIGTSFVHMVAGPRIAESVLGDLEERAAHVSNATAWIWLQILASVPAFIIAQLRSASKQAWVTQGLTTAVVLMSICFWEIAVARHVSWPVAKELLPYSPLSVGNTCRAVYVAVYGAFVLGLFVSTVSIAKARKASVHFSSWQLLNVGVVTSVPVLWLIAMPLPTDGAVWFRLAQMFFIWGICLLAVVLRWRKAPVYA